MRGIRPSTAVIQTPTSSLTPQSASPCLSWSTKTSLRRRGTNAMAISPTNTMQNHRGVYAEFTGDGSSTVLTIPLTSHYAGRSSHTGARTVITGPSNFAHKAGKGGFYFPVDGTSVAVSSAVISGSNAVITNDRRGRQPNEGLRGFHFRPVERAR